MSNLRIDNIAPSAGGTYRNAPRGIAAVWVNFNGQNTVAIMDSLNVTSLTDNGTGDYTIFINNNMSSAEYAIVDGTYRLENDNSPGITGFETPTSGQYTHNHWNSGFAVNDMFRTYSTVMGDLA
jgi:hypothetical protein